MPKPLTPKSPRWNDFCNALCEAMTADDDPNHWRCDGDRGQAGDNVYRHARQVMQSMRHVDIEGSLAYFEQHGGYCDCKILTEVDGDHLAKFKFSSDDDDPPMTISHPDQERRGKVIVLLGKKQLQENRQLAEMVMPYLRMRQ